MLATTARAGRGFTLRPRFRPSLHFGREAMSLCRPPRRIPADLGGRWMGRRVPGTTLPMTASRLVTSMPRRGRFSILGLPLRLSNLVTRVLAENTTSMERVCSSHVSGSVVTVWKSWSFDAVRGAMRFRSRPDGKVWACPWQAKLVEVVRVGNSQGLSIAAGHSTRTKSAFEWRIRMARVVVVASCLVTLALVWGCGSEVGSDTNPGDTTEPGDGGCGWQCGEMVTVSGGAFWQGCNPSVETRCFSEENPYHEVNVPAFEIDRYEVTVDAYGSCVTAGGCTAPLTYSSYCNWGVSGKKDHPVNCISWYQAGEYCSWAGKRLCSESEWEKASRGTDGRIYPWGNETATCQYAVMYERGAGCGTDSTKAVGSKPGGASPYGAQDMSGNVWEWVEDVWHSDYSGAPTSGGAWTGSPRASCRVCRGGGFAYDGDGLRSSHRDSGDAPDYANGHVGTRCCRSK